VREGAATHGCIGIPPEFAKLLFGAIERGDEVVIV
jgi:lipoprotein-anchoring transpeptidase ErfK/SrfK